LSWEEVREKMSQGSEPCLILFGTGWGIAEEVLEKADFSVEPIRGNADYNHLSVRAAAAVMLDRLCGH
jgi:hypothetical protein